MQRARRSKGRRARVRTGAPAGCESGASSSVAREAPRRQAGPAPARPWPRRAIGAPRRPPASCPMRHSRRRNARPSRPRRRRVPGGPTHHDGRTCRPAGCRRARAGRLLERDQERLGRGTAVRAVDGRADDHGVGGLDLAQTAPQAVLGWAGAARRWRCGRTARDIVQPVTRTFSTLSELGLDPLRPEALDQTRGGAPRQGPRGSLLPSNTTTFMRLALRLPACRRGADQALSFLSAQAMLRPSVTMVCMPSSSFSTSPLSRPMPRFQ